MSKYQDRYLAYCKYHKLNPDNTFKKLKGEKYINWIQNSLNDFCRKFDIKKPLSDDEQTQFTRFLNWKVESKRKERRKNGNK